MIEKADHSLRMFYSYETQKEAGREVPVQLPGSAGKSAAGKEAEVGTGF